MGGKWFFFWEKHRYFPEALNGLGLAYMTEMVNPILLCSID